MREWMQSTMNQLHEGCGCLPVNLAFQKKVAKTAGLRCRLFTSISPASYRHRSKQTPLPASSPSNFPRKLDSGALQFPPTSSKSSDVSGSFAQASLMRKGSCGLMRSSNLMSCQSMKAACWRMLAVASLMMRVIWFSRVFLGVMFFLVSMPSWSARLLLRRSTASLLSSRSTRYSAYPANLPSLRSYRRRLSLISRMMSVSSTASLPCTPEEKAISQPMAFSETVQISFSSRMTFSIFSCAFFMPGQQVNLSAMAASTSRTNSENYTKLRCLGTSINARWRQQANLRHDQRKEMEQQSISLMRESTCGERQGLTAGLARQWKRYLQKRSLELYSLQWYFSKLTRAVSCLLSKLLKVGRMATKLFPFRPFSKQYKLRSSRSLIAPMMNTTSALSGCSYRQTYMCSTISRTSARYSTTTSTLSSSRPKIIPRSSLNFACSCAEKDLNQSSWFLRNSRVNIWLWMPLEYSSWHCPAMSSMVDRRESSTRLSQISRQAQTSRLYTLSVLSSTLLVPVWLQMIQNSCSSSSIVLFMPPPAAALISETMAEQIQKVSFVKSAARDACGDGGGAGGRAVGEVFDGGQRPVAQGDAVGDALR